MTTENFNSNSMYYLTFKVLDVPTLFSFMYVCFYIVMNNILDLIDNGSKNPV